MRYDRTGPDHCAFTDRNTLQNTHVESDPCLVLHHHARVGDMLPVLPPAAPVADIFAALFPFEAVGIVIDDGNSPRYDHVVTDCDASVADEMASSKKTTVSDSDFATSLF